MKDLSKATNVKKYFSDLLVKLKGCKVKAVYSHGVFFSTREGYSCMTDEPIYIIFDDGKCLVLDYYFIDELRIEYREMIESEIKLYKEHPYDDYFNCVHKVHDGITHKLKEVIKVSLIYGEIIDVKLTAVREEYNKWIDHQLEIVQPNEETFNQIEFVMDNGTSFVVYAGDAEIDGYSFFESKDVFMSIENI